MNIDPEVKSQRDALIKAREGLKAAKQVLESVTGILKVYPDDKTAIRAKADAETMVNRFEKHEIEAHKIIEKLTKKVLPPNLKKVGQVAEKLLRDRLVDPNSLKVIPWQVNSTRWVGRQSIESVEFQIVFRVGLVGGDVSKHTGQFVLSEHTGVLDGLRLTYGTWEGVGVGSPKEVVEFIVKKLADEGWTGLKGQSEVISGREATAKAIQQIITDVCRSGSYDSERAEISQDNRRIECSYRSNLPKEGERSVGEDRYYEMVGDEIARFRKRLDPALSRYKDQIQSIDIHDGEKSWIYVVVTLK